GRSPRSRASPPGGCRPGSSACTPSWDTRSRSARGSTPSATARSSSWTSAGRRCVAAADRLSSLHSLHSYHTATRQGAHVIRVAAIDCGTNSIRLLIADHDGDRLTDIVRLMRVVRLGQGVDRTGEFAPEAVARTLEATDDYAALCRQHGVPGIRFVATSATRDARNREEFTAGVRERLGAAPEVISGTTEARLSFTGAARVIGAGAGERPGPALVVDLGGGSTELVLGDSSGVRASWSMDVGCVRITERHLAGDPPTEAQVMAARADVRAAIAQAARVVPLER